MTPAEQPLQPHAQREVELKFRVHGLFRLPDLQTIDGVAEIDELGSVELRSAYFDTADLRLAREGITLRRRTGDDEGWHLKVPTDSPGVRTEIRLPLAAAEADAPPEALLRVVRVLIRQATVSLVATLRTERFARLIKNGKGRPVAELVDDTVYVIAPDGTVTARFRELELEERRGGAALSRVADALTSAGAVGGEFVAKVVRALGPAAAADPEIPPPAAPRLKDPAGDAAVAYLATQVRALRAADLTFRGNIGVHTDHDQLPVAEEAVHQMRVAARRLRGALRTFQPLFEPDWAAQLRTELAWFAHGLNDLRENEVLRARLAAHLAELPAEIAVEAVRAFLDTEQTRAVGLAREEALRVLDSDRYLALHDQLIDAANHPPLTEAAEAPAREVLPALVKATWRRLAKPAERLDERAPAERWHALRLRAKRARYAAEAVATVVGDEAKAFARQVERLTELLGEHQDATQAAGLLHRLAGRTDDVEVAFGLGALASIEHQHAAAARHSFGTVWPQVRKAKWRRWFEPV